MKTFQEKTFSIKRLFLIGIIGTLSIFPITAFAISGTDKPPQARNLGGAPTYAPSYKGTAVFTGAASVTVAFNAAEPDANYNIGLGPQANETMWVTSKTTSGFTLNSSNASSMAKCDWIKYR